MFEYQPLSYLFQNQFCMNIMMQMEGVVESHICMFIVFSILKRSDIV